MSYVLSNKLTDIEETPLSMTYISFQLLLHFVLGIRNIAVDL